MNPRIEGVAPPYYIETRAVYNFDTKRWTIAFDEGFWPTDSEGLLSTLTGTGSTFDEAFEMFVRKLRYITREPGSGRGPLRSA
jgi:hypothetical protein